MIYNRVVGTVVLLVFFGIYSSHEERIFITISLFVRCFITDVNLGDVIEILDVLLSPVVHHLRSPVAPLRASMALA